MSSENSIYNIYILKNSNKAESEKEWRVKKKVEDSLREKSIFDLAKMVGKEAVSNCGLWLKEAKQKNDASYK